MSNKSFDLENVVTFGCQILLEHLKGF